jgi:hypothetical protein
VRITSNMQTGPVLSVFSCTSIFTMYMKPLIKVQRAYNRSSLKNHHPFKLCKLLYEKETAWQVYHNFHKDESLNAWELSANQCRQATRNFHAVFEEKIILSASINKFYRYANCRFVKKTPICPLKRTDAA